MNPSTKIGQVMTRNAIVANPSHTFSQVCRLFTDYSLHHLPVVDADGALIGIISTSDVINAYRYQMPDNAKADDQERIDAAIPITRLMTAQPATLSEHDTIGDAADLIASHHFQAVPIVDDNNQVVGILTTRDIVIYFAQNT